MKDLNGRSMILQHHDGSEPSVNGGSTIFIPGKGAPPDGKDGEIILRLASGKDFLRLTVDGAFIGNEKVDDSRAVYDRFVYWLSFGTKNYGTEQLDTKIEGGDV